MGFITKKHRLSGYLYRGCVRGSFTLCLRERNKAFADAELVSECLCILEEVLSKQQCLNLIYVFMPDHLHLVLEGNDDESDLLKAVRVFKQRTGFLFAKKVRSIEWQKSFYDFLHRREASLREHVYYIANNPVRAGLVEDWWQYPFLGSLDHDVSALLNGE